MRRERVRELLTIAALAVAVLVFFADILVGGLNLYLRDVARSFYPERRVLAEILRSGELPFWNPYVSGGQPLAANPGYGAFYPLQWLLALGSFRNAFHLVVVLHYPLAAAGMYVLTRSFGVRRSVACFAGFSYALGGTMLSLGSLLPYLYSMAWMPWIGFFVIRRRLASAAVTLGVLLLIGDVSMILQAGGLLMVCAIYAAWRERSMRPIALAVLTIVLATLVGAAQIIPALDHQRDSGRAHAFTLAEATRWTLPAIRPLEMIWPSLFGSSWPEFVFQWGLARLYPTEQWPWVISFYPGLVATLLVIAGFAARVRGAMLVAFIAVTGYLLATGPVLYHLGLRSLRYPEKFMLSTIFVLAVFAGVVAEEALRSAKVKNSMLVAASIVTAMTAIAAAITTLPGYPAWFARTAGLEAINPDLAWRFRGDLFFTLALAAIVTGILAADRLSPRWRLALLALVTIVDLGARLQICMPRIAPDYYSPPPAARALARAPKRARIYSEADWAELHEKPRVLPSGIVAWITRNGLYPAFEITFGFDGIIDADVSRTNLLPSIEFANLFHLLEAKGRVERLPLLLQMAGATHVGIERPLDDAILSDPRRFKEIEPVRFIATDNEGPYYFAERILPDVRAMVSNDEIPPRAAFVRIPPFDPAPGSVITARRTSNSISLDVTAGGRAFLVLAVTPHKYWRATIDGRPAELHLANVAFQGLVVEGGRHHIEMRYRNPLIIASAMVSALSAMALMIAALRSRGSPPPPPR